MTITACSLCGHDTPDALCRRCHESMTNIIEDRKALLAACEDIVADWDREEGTDETLEICVVTARAAVAKAKEGTQ